MGADSTSPSTTLMFRVDPVTGYLLINVASDSLVATSATKDKRDQNFRPTMYGISSVDGTTLVPIRTDSNGVLLLDIA